MSDVRPGWPTGILNDVAFTVSIPKAAASSDSRNGLIGFGGIAGAGRWRLADIGERLPPMRTTCITFRSVQEVIDMHRDALVGA